MSWQRQVRRKDSSACSAVARVSPLQAAVNLPSDDKTTRVQSDLPEDSTILQGPSCEQNEKELTAISLKQYGC